MFYFVVKDFLLVLMGVEEAQIQLPMDLMIWVYGVKLHIKKHYV